MMNYQYPASYMMENTEQLLKIGPTPPPILPSLDQNEIEQTLYQRRVSDANGLEAPADSLQPLEINYSNQYYAAPAQQRSAPVQPNNMMQSAVLFSKTPNVANVVSMNSMNGLKSTDKPPATPPPPPQPQAGPKKSGTKPTSLMSHSHHDIVAITPQSHVHLNSNSASNHSTASNNTTTTTVIESASHSSHSHSSHTHSPHTIHSPSKQLKSHFTHKVVQNVAAKIAAPQLAHPLPAHNKIGGVTEGIVIPMDQQNYTAFLSQMYGNQVPAVNGLSAATHSGYTQHAAHATHTVHPAHSHEVTYHQQDIYGTTSYESNPYGLYNTPPLPSHHGYHAGNAVHHNYYAQQPATAPSHILSPPHSHYSQIPKSAEVYTHTQSNNGYNNYYQQQQQSPHSSHHLSQQSPKTVSNTSPPHSHSHSHSHSRSTKSISQQIEDIAITDAQSVQFLHRCDGTIISPHSNPVTVQQIIMNTNKDDELDAFTAGDDALFGNNMVTIISVNWTTNIPFATVRIHLSNRIHHVPLMDLTHISNPNHCGAKKQQKSAQHAQVTNAQNNARYRLGLNGAAAVNKPGAVTAEGQAVDIGATIIRRNPKLSDETLMKLPHLRKHREYIRTIDVNMGPKDYNSYRVSVNSKANNGSDDDADNGRTANIQNLNAKPAPHGHSNLNRNLNASHHGHNNKKKNKRMSACEKGDLFKTELCENWVKKGHCTYGKKCHFAHGREDIRTRWRIENYKTQPCCDPARADSRLCLFGKRCNYAHPGEPLRRSHHCQYLDEEYQDEILKDYGPTTPYPFGIYI